MVTKAERFANEMRYYRLHTKRQILIQFNEIDAMFDMQTERLCRRVEINGGDEQATVQERVQLEMCAGGQDGHYHDAVSERALLSEAPEWYDGFKCGMMRGYWEALQWVLSSDNNTDLLELNDIRKDAA